jgi:hypothetical protein
MEEKNINPTESLKIIEEMVNKAKNNYSDNSFYFIFWGWLAFIAAISQYFLIPIIGGQKSSMVWLLMPLGGVVSMFYGMKQSKKQKVVSHIESMIGFIWLGMGLGFVVLMTGMTQPNAANLLPMFILLYAIGTFITGGVLKFKPLIVGGSLCFVICLLAFHSPISSQLLLLALAVLVSYLIPGYMLKAKFKSMHV